jgi:hypothetical protein
LTPSEKFRFQIQSCCFDLDPLKKTQIISPTLFGILAFAPNSQAVTIICSESFTAPDGTTLLGFVPSTNNGIPGATFHESDNFWTANSAVGIFGNRAQLGADNQASLPIDSSGGFVQPEVIRVSALMNLGSTAGPSTPNLSEVQRGVGLGFYAGTVATPDDFRGLIITTDGRLILGQHGLNGLTRAGFIEEIASGLDTSADHTLSFEIDTVTGDMSNITLNGTLQPDVTTTLFASNVNEVGFMVSSAAGGTLATYDDFEVSAIPEPSSLSLLGLGAMLVGLRRRKK